MTSYLGRRAATAGAVLVAGLPGRAKAQKTTIRIGLLSDMSGPYADGTGLGSLAACKLAVDDVMRTNPGFDVEIVAGDMLDKADVGTSIARGWFDNGGVDVVVDVPQSAVALAVATVLKEKDKVGLFAGPGSAELSGKACSPNHVHWTYDTWALSSGTGKSVVAEGGDSWFFITANYAFGHALENDCGNFVREAGGRVVGSVRFPFPGTTDFSAFLLQAQGSLAKVVGLATAGGDTSNLIKQAAEFGVVRGGQRLAALLFLINDVHSTGLEAAQGLILTDAFYWDFNDECRAFSARFAAVMRDRKPSMVHAGVYSATLHYLKTVAAMGAAKAKVSGRATIAAMKAIPTDDPLFGRGEIRADGRKIHAMHLFQVKTPAESKYAWDYYKHLRTIPADQAFRPIGAGGCPLIPA